ncbi:MAG: GNAT family N-acetyltransferase [Pseudomonadota bacterium]
MRDLPDGYSITGVSLEDIPTIIAVDKAAAALFAPTGLITPQALEEHVPADVLEDAIPSSAVLAVRDAHGEVVGFALFQPRGLGIYLDQISVHPDHGRKGLGRALMQRVIETAEDSGHQRLSLSTFRDLPWNGPFYRSLGFKALKRDKLEPYMIEIEAAQRPHMDVTARCFMARKVRRPLFRRRRA